MLHFEDDKNFTQPPLEVWAKLSDARFLVQCVPDVESVATSDPGKVVCTIRPGFAFVRGTLELTIQITDAAPSTSALLLLHTKGIGSTTDVEARLTLTPQGNGTRLHWSVDIKNLGGLFKAVPQGLLKAAAQKVIADALAAAEDKLRG
jgi:2-furoyl-CoA dehydrogenase large subunit